MGPPPCERCAAPGRARAQRSRQTTWGSRVVDIVLCDACFERGRPLSPFEYATNQRFWDHCTDLDRQMDIFLSKARFANIVGTSPTKGAGLCG